MINKGRSPRRPTAQGGGVMSNPAVSIISAINKIPDLEARIASLTAEIERLRNDLRDWAECSSIKVTMEGPRLMGWNSSALNRCLAKYEAAALQPKEDAA